MKTRKTFFAIAALELLVTPLTLALAGNEHGNGGDPLIYRFETARRIATERVRALNSKSFGSGVDPKMISFLLDHQKELADDISASKHQWTGEATETCARTLRQSRAGITLSTRSCTSTSLQEAISLLIHESIHHLGIDDETQAYQMSQAAAEATTSRKGLIQVQIDRATRSSIKSDTEESELDTIDDLLQATLGSQKGYAVSKGAASADLTLRPRLIKFGSAYMLHIDRVEKNEVVFSAHLKSDQIEELDTVVERVALAALESKEVSETARLGTVTSAETGVTARKGARKQWIIGYGPILLLGADSRGVGQMISGAYVWDFGNSAIQIQGHLLGKGPSSFGSIGLGVQKFLDDKDSAPFLSAGFGYGGGLYEHTKEHFEGFSLNAAAGYQFFRLSSVNLEVSLGCITVLHKTSQGLPTGLGLRIGILF